MKKTITALSIILAFPSLANMNDHVASETRTGHKVEIQRTSSDYSSANGIQGQIGNETIAVTLGSSFTDHVDMLNAGVKYGGENYFGEVSTTWYDVDNMNNTYDFSFGYQWGNEDSLTNVKIIHNRLNQDFDFGYGSAVESKLQTTNLHFGGVQILDGEITEGVYLTYGTGLQYSSIKVKDSINPSVSDSETGVYGEVGIGYTVNGFNVAGDLNYNTNIEEMIFTIKAGYNF